MELIGGERRRRTRYALELPLRFHYAIDGVSQTAGGVTTDLSRFGVLFQAEEPPPVDVAIELEIDWPFLLQGVCPLRLVMKGKVVQASSRGTAVAIENYEFRTCGQRSFSQTAYSPKTSLVG